MPVGHIVLAVRFAMEHYGLAGYIDDLFVQPAFRRRGIACALIDAFVADLRRGDVLEALPGVDTPRYTDRLTFPVG